MHCRPRFLPLGIERKEGETFGLALFLCLEKTQL